MESRPSKKVATIDSGLPEEILQHIVSLLDQKSAIQTSVLSKSWRHLWYTRPEFNFYGPPASPTLPYLPFLERTFQFYQDQHLSVVHDLKLILWLQPPEYEPTFSFLNNWIPILVLSMPRLNTFDLKLHSSSMFKLPSVLFESESSALQNLTLRSCVVTSTRSVSLKHLQRLCLQHVRIPQETLDSILSNCCPCIQDVQLSICTGFKTIKPPASCKLKRLIFCGAPSRIRGSVTIEIHDETNIQTIRISRCRLFSVVSRRRRFYYNFAHLKSLKLTRVDLSLPDLFSRCSLPCLEELELHQCPGIDELNLQSSPLMKRLAITNINSPFRVKVDAPSIVSFLYKGILPQSISFSSAPTTTWNSRIHLTSSQSYSFNELKGMLMELRSRQSKISLQLDVNVIHGLMMQNQPAGDFVGTEEHLILDIDFLQGSRFSSAADFLNNLFRMFRPSSVIMDLLPLRIIKNKQLHEIAELLLLEDRDDYFWQRALEGVSLRFWHGHPRRRGKWKPLKPTSFPELSKKCSSEKMVTICLPLKWRKE